MLNLLGSHQNIGKLILELERFVGEVMGLAWPARYCTSSSGTSWESRSVTTRTRNQALEAVGADLRANIAKFFVSLRQHYLKT